jgi:hypothetical protein
VPRFGGANSAGESHNSLIFNFLFHFSKTKNATRLASEWRSVCLFFVIEKLLAAFQFGLQLGQFGSFAIASEGGLLGPSSGVVHLVALTGSLEDGFDGGGLGGSQLREVGDTGSHEQLGNFGTDALDDGQVVGLGSGWLSGFFRSFFLGCSGFFGGWSSRRTCVSGGFGYFFGGFFAGGEGLVEEVLLFDDFAVGPHATDDFVVHEGLAGVVDKIKRELRVGFVIAHERHGVAFDVVGAGYVVEEPTETLAFFGFGAGDVVRVAVCNHVFGRELFECAEDVAAYDLCVHGFDQLIELHVLLFFLCARKFAPQRYINLFSELKMV